MIENMQIFIFNTIFMSFRFVYAALNQYCAFHAIAWFMCAVVKPLFSIVLFFLSFFGLSLNKNFFNFPNLWFGVGSFFGEMRDSSTNPFPIFGVDGWRTYLKNILRLHSLSVGVCEQAFFSLSNLFWFGKNWL